MSEVAAAWGWSAAAAATAAYDRAVSCQQRLRALRHRRPIDDADARRARDHLAEARERAAAADSRRRLGASRSAARTVARGGSGRAATPGETPLADRLLQYNVSFSALFDRYFALGGAYERFDVDAHVHGLMELPAPDGGMVEHALWELIELAED